MKSVTIIGAGLVGTLLSLYLVNRGYKVQIYESRLDPRIYKKESGRSINLALSCRGLTALTEINLGSLVKKLCTPMRARAIHDQNGRIQYQPFGRTKNEYINAIQRNDLNDLLLNLAEDNSNIEIYFGVKLVDLNLENKELQLKSKGAFFSEPYEILIGADGAGSSMRDSLFKNKTISASRIYLSHGYKEISITKKSTKLAKEHLHLWPRDSFLLLGNPNIDHSITGSLFLPQEGINSFSELNNELKINHFFQKSFADIFEEMPDLIGDFLDHPTGTMSTIHTSPWYFENCLLIGDAAHGITPFFGQGMNCGFEDCRILNQLLDQYHEDWKQVMPAFYDLRKKDTEAVAVMSMDNYKEIQSDIRDPKFNLKKEVQQALMHHYPEKYVSKHVLVMFTNIAYSKAERIGELQDELLNTICAKKNSLKEIDWENVELLIEKYDKKLADL